MPDPTPRPPQPSPPNARILIIRPTALGDVSRTVPALVTLRQAFPQAQIDWLVSAAFADVIRAHPSLNHVVTFPRKRFGSACYNPRAAAEALAWAQHLRKQRYHLVIDLQGLARSGVFTWLTGAKQRVGCADARELAWLAYNRRHRIQQRLHTVDQMLALLAAQGYTPSHDMRLYLQDQDRSWLDSWLGRHGGPGPYACLAPTARWRCKSWPIENYTRIAQRLIETKLLGDRFVILAGPNERQAIQPLLDALPSRATTLAPQTTVGQMMAIISQAGLVVCNDSGPLHIAVGFNRPIASLFGPTDPTLVGPYQRQETVITPPGITPDQMRHYRRQRDDQSLIAKITVDAVWEKIIEQVGHDTG